MRRFRLSRNVLSLILLCSILWAYLSCSAFASAEDVTAVTPVVAAGYYHTVALKSDGTVWAWGRNTVGQLGDGTTIRRNQPVKVAGLTDIIMIDADGSGDTLKISKDNLSMVSQTIALKKDGTVWCWGSNRWGQLGDGTRNNRSKPTQVAGLTNIIAISAGSYHCLALKSDGTVWVWGSNEYGQAGDGTKGDHNFWTIDNIKLKPVQISGLKDIIAISAGFDHSAALRKDGTVWTWGGNHEGQIGNKTTTDQLTPVKVSKLSSIISVSAGYQGTASVSEDGTVWCWGNNRQGQLGSSCQDSYSTKPVAFDGMTHMRQIVYAFMHLIALNDAGQAVTWGDYVGTVPVFSGAMSLAGGREHSVILKKDGTVWCSGYNCDGQFGNSMTSNEQSAEFIKISGINLYGTAAMPTTSKVIINGYPASFNAYTIRGHNYFRLRELAKALSGTAVQFDVTWDGTDNHINVTTNSAYSPAAGEADHKSVNKNEEAVPTASGILVDGKEMTFSAYTIDGSNYFMLRDLARVLNFSVIWDGDTNSIVVDTTKGYTE